jgi:predicted ester cyclase
MALAGFDARWKDETDFILGVTKEIWEDRGIATLDRYYADDIVVRSPASVVVGNKDVIGATMSTLAEFPDRQLLGEDVITCASADGGFLSSHRLLSTATHTHHGAYGAPTGKRLQYRIIADCHAVSNKINDEWLIRDQGAIVRQLGVTPRDYAAQLITAEGGVEACVTPYTPANNVIGPYQGSGNDNEWGARLADMVTRIAEADFTVIQREYDRAAMLYYPGGQNTQGHAGADQFWIALRAAFPKAEFAVHHVIGRDDPLMPPRASLRWSLQGAHEGWGAFGRPTGAAVHVMGKTHAEFGPRGLRREFTLFDETAIWKQILMQTGDV